ncbi:hypothetical protein [Corynebacterium pacaense]|uniref:hypothetical protein n=1 Tax=Corynebacterium pacaense TaxID=1816684 RepID=UPI0009BA98C8|nr:hypothetical protein [Corynebacterium pacaense]
MNFSALFGSLIEVTIVGIVLGAGLPALFALGIRLAHGPSTSDGGASSTTPGKVAAVLCFAVIILAIAVGILWITKGTIHQYLGVDIFGTEA